MRALSLTVEPQPNLGRAFLTKFGSAAREYERLSSL
jgi:hypothetical protein